MILRRLENHSGATCHCGAASPARYFGTKIADISTVFASNRNKCDSREFELFLLDLDGKNLRQVTEFGGFTSFPEFSPDGRRMAFTSDRNATSPYEFNIFVADWTGPQQ